MSLYDYQRSQVLNQLQFPFYSLIMAAMRQADSTNILKLRREFPDVWKELRERYQAPGGLIGDESIDD